MDTLSTTTHNHTLIEAFLNSSGMAIACFDNTFKINRCNSLFTKYLRSNSHPDFLYETELFEEDELKSLNRQLEEQEVKELNFTKAININNRAELLIEVKVIGEYCEKEWTGGAVFFKEAKTSGELELNIPETDDGQKEDSKLKRSVKLFHTIYENSPLGLLRVCEHTAKILRANPRICKMLGYTEAEMQLMTAYDITHPDDRTKHKASFEKTISGEQENFDIEKRYVKKDGGIIWVNVAVTVLKDEEGIPQYDLAMIQDITEKYKAKELVKEQVKALNLQNQKLEKYIDSNLQLENFAYIASHDLKAPLRTIGNFAQLLQRRIGKNFNVEENEYMDFILEGVKDMNQLIEDLLIYSKINSTENVVQEVDVQHILNNVLRNLSAAISDRSAKVTMENIPTTILANKTKITQLFQNLIANGMKFQSQDNKPVVKVSCIEMEKEWQFQVADNGIGIEKEYHEQVFTLFKRLHGKQEYDGSGIGLAYCKRVVDKHGGSIWLESELGKGTTFFVSLPKELELA